jgi:hypothetical protein
MFTKKCYRSIRIVFEIREKGIFTAIAEECALFLENLKKFLKVFFRFSEKTIYEAGTKTSQGGNMTVQAVRASWTNLTQLLSKSAGVSSSTGTGSTAGQTGSPDSYSGSNGTSGLSLKSGNYLVTNLNVQYQSADGDSVSLSSQSVEIQKAALSASGDNSQADWNKVADYLKQELSSLKSEIVNKLFGGKEQSTASAAPTASNSTSSADGIAGLPDYWSSENTSQRIVDFATSFLGAFKGSGSEFLSTIKDAIDKGFSEAEGVTGKLPDAVTGLVNKTHELVMQKLDAWAQQQDITVADSGTDASTTSNSQATAA